jgi:Bacterial regulatory proteins, tetR family
MSRKETGARSEGRKKDRRIRRTQERLGMALLQLILEKSFDSVTVQDVLDRAAVGRSTFYLHFRDKKLSAKKERSHRLAPVTEMFEHIGEQKKLYRALGQSGRLHDFFDLAQGYFARGIEQRLKETKFQPDASQTEQVLLSVALAGSLLSLFRWWMDRGGKLPASSMDKHFHRMAWGNGTKLQNRSN